MSNIKLFVVLYTNSPADFQSEKFSPWAEVNPQGVYWIDLKQGTEVNLSSFRPEHMPYQPLGIYSNANQELSQSDWDKNAAEFLELLKKVCVADPFLPYSRQGCRKKDSQHTARSHRKNISFGFHFIFWGNR